jgi:hypothetical protein
VACLQCIGIARQGGDAHGAFILDNSVACQDWGRTNGSFGSSKTVKSAVDDVKNYSDRIAAIELY